MHIGELSDQITAAISAGDYTAIAQLGEEITALQAQREEAERAEQAAAGRIQRLREQLATAQQNGDYAAVVQLAEELESVKAEATAGAPPPPPPPSPTASCECDSGWTGDSCEDTVAATAGRAGGSAPTDSSWMGVRDGGAVASNLPFLKGVGSKVGCAALLGLVAAQLRRKRRADAAGRKKRSELVANASVGGADAGGRKSGTSELAEPLVNVL